MKTAVVRARVPEKLKKEFSKAVAAHGLNQSHAIRQLMNQYVENEKELSRRHRETLEALEDIESGRVFDGKTVLAWLDSWGKENEIEPPQ